MTQEPTPISTREAPPSAPPVPLEDLEWRVNARRLPDGRVEVALQARTPADGAWSGRLLPEHRFLPAGLEAGRWLLSSPPDGVSILAHP